MNNDNSFWFFAYALTCFIIGMCWGILLMPNQVIDTTPIIHVEKVNKTFETIVFKIVSQSYGSKVSTDTALKIAKCESQLGTNIINPYSSARGVYQFTKNTWLHYCEGDVMDPDDNIKCFIKLYPLHSNWWECKE